MFCMSGRELYDDTISYLYRQYSSTTKVDDGSTHSNMETRSSSDGCLENIECCGVIERVCDE